jgi:protein TonB
MLANPSAVAAAVRLGSALGASLALHAAAALVLAKLPAGSPAGGAPVASQSLNVRILAASPRPEPQASTSAAGAPQTLPRARDPTSAAAATAPRSLGPPEPVYYRPAELDVRPRLTTRVDPVYPQLAPPDGGYVVLRLLIGEDGWVEKALVVVADPVGYFEEAASEAFAKARFVPGRRGGIAVKSQLWIELKFNPLVPAESRRSESDRAAR